MSRSCSNKNEVLVNFNKMNDARAFTDYRSNNETFRELYRKTQQICDSTKNSYDSRICSQRNGNLVLYQTCNDYSKTHALPRCKNNKEVQNTGEPSNYKLN